MHPSRLLTGLLMAVLIAGAAAQQAGAADLTRLRAALATARFVAYTPRAFRPDPANRVAPAQIAADLDLLKASFDGLITYSTGKGLDLVPELAAARGFRAVVLGVWDPLDRNETDRAIALCRRFDRLIVGLSLGNEGIVSKRYTWPELVAALDRVRRALPDLPLTTGEPFAFLLDAPPEATAKLDFFTPNIHPLSEPWFARAPEPAAVEFVAGVLDRMRGFGKPILVKETGLPSGPPSQNLSAARQARFWNGLFAVLRPGPDLAVAAFEAFDAPWKPAEIAVHFDTVMPGEAHWGFFTVDGRPKPVLDAWRKARTKAAVGKPARRS